MADIGDDVVVTTTVRVAEVLTDPAGVTLAVTAPDGTDSAPTPTNPSVGVYEALVPVDQAGRWRYTWSTTDPTGVEHGYFDVAGDPPPPGRQDTLATVADLEARLGRTLTEGEALRAAALLADASAMIRNYTGQQFDYVPNDQVTLRPVGTIVRLPQRPVTAVSAVVATGGSDAIPDIPLPNGAWTWDGIDKVDIWPPDSSWLLSLPETWSDGSLVDTYRVTYSHGYPTPPADVVAVACAMAIRVLTSPSQVPGMVAERIGNYNYQLQQGMGASGATARMSPDDRQALSRYRRGSGTIQVRAA